MAEKYFKQESKKEWFTSAPVTNDDLRTGCLMRIADATEKMASNYTELQNNLEWYKRRFNEKTEEIATLEKRVAAYKGVINRMKKNKK